MSITPSVSRLRENVPLAPLPPEAWHRLAGIRLRSEWQLKVSSSLAFMAVFFAGYFLLLRFPVFPAATMPESALDKLIGFQPNALGLYVSLWLYVQIPAALLLTRREVVNYGKYISLLALVGFVIFFFLPTRLGPSGINGDQHPAFVFLQGVDASGNACPSLHVAFAVFSGIWIEQALRAIRAPLWTQILNTAWCLGIAYSTVATRQHVSLDVLAGAALAIAVAAFTRRAEAVAPAGVSTRRHRCGTKAPLSVPNSVGDRPSR